MSTAVLVGGGGFQGLPVLRSLHAIGWRVVVADSVCNSVNRYESDVFHQMPEARHYEKFRADLLSLVERTHAKAVFPTTMHDLPVLARLRPELESLGLDVFVSDPDAVALLSDKMRTLFSCLEAELPILPAIDPECHDFSYSLIGKPVCGWGGIGVVRISSLESWKAFKNLGKIARYVWQKNLMEFTEWSVDFAIDKGGTHSELVCRRRLRTSGGFALVNDVLDCDKIKKVAIRVVAWLTEKKGCGLFNIQILEEPNGDCWLSDINPRPGTSSICGLCAGVNFVEFLVSKESIQKKPSAGLVVRTLRESFFPRLTQKIRGVVFDLDETLICQKMWMLDKLKIVLNQFPANVDAVQLSRFRLEALRLVDEGPWHQLIEIALSRSALPFSLLEGLIHLWRSASPAEIFVHQDAFALILALRERNIKIALISDNPKLSQKEKILKIPHEIYFDSMVLTDDISEPKPSPKGFLRVADDLSLSPEDLLMVGDSPWRDGVGAIKAGYAGAVIVRRSGGMTNALPALFNQEFPEMRERLSWVESLFGLLHVFKFSD